VELQREVAAIRFEASVGRVVRVSSSIGAAVFPGDGETYEALLATADGRMYHDKKSRKRLEMRPRPASFVESGLVDGFADERALSNAVPPRRGRVN
jgi:GGDEF domain-containing protein